METKIIAQNGAVVNTEDRLALASLLLKHGYTVRIGKDKIGGKTVTYIAFEEAEK